MAYQLIVDNRVECTAPTLDDALSLAAERLKEPQLSRLEIVNLAGGICRHDDIVALLKSETGRDSDEDTSTK